MSSSDNTTARCFKRDDELDLLFPAAHIPDGVKKDLHPDLHIRPLAVTDYNRGHLDLLNALSKSPDPGEEQWTNLFNTMRSLKRTYYPLAIVDKQTDIIVGLGTVFMESKFQRRTGSVGHIEDIVVDKRLRGKSLGLLIIKALTYISENNGAYKTILNCNDDNIAFYEKCGYEKKENEMVKYAPEAHKL